MKKQIILSISVSILLLFNSSVRSFAVDATPIASGPTNQQDRFATDLFTGSAAYSYPIKVPQGTNNLTPPVSLDYNSGGVHDLNLQSGAGWELSQDYIERDINYTPSSTSDDKYILHFQGQTYNLVYVSSDSRYHTKIESYLNIQKLTGSTSNTQGDYWQIIAPDGTQYRFGYTSTSEVMCSGQSYVTHWNLDQVTDTHGNKIYYTYTQSSGVSYLSEIDYDNDQTRKVKFTYSTITSPFVRKLYIQGCTVTDDLSLQTIKTYISSTLVREYDLSYSNASEGQPLLAGITEKGSDGTALPETTFDYNSVVKSWEYPNETWSNVHGDFRNYLTFLMDVDGDGIPDMVEVTYSGSNDTYTVYKGTGSGWNTTGSTWLNNASIDCRPDEYNCRIIDINGDGLPDIVKTTFSGSNTTWHVWLNTGSGWSTTDTPWTTSGIDAHFDSTSNEVGIADVNGDGLPDIIKTVPVSGPYTTIDVWKNTGSGFNTTPETWINNQNVDWRFYENNVDLVDVNGDGLPDLVKANAGSGAAYDYEVYYNTGSGWETSPTTWNNTTIDDNIWTPNIGIADVTGDGLPEVVDVVQPSLDNFLVYANNGSKWASSYDTWISSIDANMSTHDTILADANGDGLLDIVKSNGGATDVWKNNGYAPDLLETVHTSQGGSIHFDYTPSTTYSNTSLPYPIWVVSKKTVNNGLTSSQETNDITSYTYKNGLYNWQNKEFRGFGEVDETDPNGSKKQTYFKQDDGLQGTMYDQKTNDGSGNPYTETVDTWNSASSSGVFTNTLTSDKQYTYDGTSSGPKINETDYTYDSYGNVTKESDLGDISISTDNRYTYKTYTYNTSSWIVDLPYDTYVNKSDDSTKVSETWDYYDNNTNLTDSPTKGDLTKEVKWLSGGTNPTTTYTYDSYGNKTQETDANSHSTSWSYGTNDTTYTYPDSTTNAKSQTTHTTYDLGTGNLLSKADPNGFVTSYSYDPFGRVTQELDPDPTASGSSDLTKTYTYYDNSTPPSGVLQSQITVSSTSGLLNFYTYVDGLGRKIQTRKPAEDTSKQIVVDTFYDPTGKVEEESVPHLDTLSTTFASPSAGIEDTINIYDPIARITQVTNPQGTSTTTSYDHWTQTDTDENGHYKKKTMDAFNNIVEVDEHNNGSTYTTTYTYDALNNLTQITDAKSNNFTFTYDTLGRRTQEVDPDMGTWSYTYDGVDNLLTKTDNRGITTTNTYDELNRKSTVSYPTDTGITYTYDGNGRIGTLTSVTDAAGTESYQYDKRLRKTQDQRVTDGITWTKNYTYDQANRILTATMPDSEIVSNTYDAQGEVASVSGVVNNVDYNALNKVTSKTFNNGQTTNYTYNTNDFRLNRIQTGSTQDIGYTYDNVGNVKTTTDNLLSKTQTFGYDNLDRLTVASESAGYDYNYAYDQIGNMTSFSSPDTTTTYTYGSSTLVHAPATSTSTTMIYDDAYANGWTDASYNTTNTVQTTNVYTGSNALSSTINASGGLDFQAPRFFTSGSYTYVHFALKASASGQQYKVYADSTFGQALATPVSLASYGGQPTTSGWTVYNIPLVDLGAANVTLADIVIQNATGSNEPALYVDQVELISGALPTATPTPAPTATPTPTPTPALVQKANNYGGGTGSVAKAFTSSVTSGHTIVVMTVTSSGSNIDTTSVTDNQSNTYTQIGTTQHTSGNAYIRMWYAKNVTGGSVTVTAHQSGSASGCNMEILEYSGLSTTAPADQSASTTGSSSSPSGGNITPTASHEVVISAFTDDNSDSVSMTGTTGYTTEETQLLNSTNNRNGIEDQIQSTATATSGTWTTGSSSTWAAVIVSFKQ